MQLAIVKARSARFAAGLAAAVVVTALGASGVGAARPAPFVGSAGAPQAQTSSVIGTYTYADSFGDAGDLTFTATGHTVQFSGGCAGLWVTQKKTISFEFDSRTCGGSEVVFTATIGGKKMTGIGESADTTTSSSSFTWSAVRVS